VAYSTRSINTQFTTEKLLGNKNAKTHGLSKHYLYMTWATMKSRCYNPNSFKFNHYGARGITVYNRWLNSFLNFLEDMGDRPNGMTLSRIDNDGPYSKENCEWQTPSQQNSNRRKYKRNKHTGLFNEID